MEGRFDSISKGEAGGDGYAVILGAAITELLRLQEFCVETTEADPETVDVCREEEGWSEAEGGYSIWLVSSKAGSVIFPPRSGNGSRGQSGETLGMRARRGDRSDAFLSTYDVPSSTEDKSGNCNPESSRDSRVASYSPTRS